MNYAGKFDAAISSDGQGAASPFDVHVESVHGHVPANAIVVPDAHFLFNADFKRSGLDLVLSGDDHELVLHDYFKGEKRAPLASPDGAHLTGDIVTALTGAVDVSQAGAPAASGQVIGHVTKLVGSATVIRNGVSIILNMGENVEKGDVVQCGSNSTLGLTFIDGTVFGLSSNARMVLNEMVFDPNGSNNSSLLSLVAGTITFVAGETAKHGDMKVDTPVATMGIRGTAVLVEIDFAVPGQNATPDAHFQVLVEPDGHTGSYILFDKTTLQPIAAVNQAGQQINITNGVITQSNEPLPPDIQKLIQDVFTQKFSYNDTNKTTTAQTDTLNPLLFTGYGINAANGTIVIPQFALTGNSQTSTSSNSSTIFLPHVDVPPTVVVSGGSLTARAGAQVDIASGTIVFVDVNAIDKPTATARFNSFTVLDPNQNDITATLTAQQLAAIQAVAGQLSLSPSAGNTNIGTVSWTYSIADSAFSFLPTGDTLKLTYMVEVDTNYPPSNLAVFKPLTVTVTASNQVTWIHPTGGFWSVGSNWDDAGQVPTANDDVIIPAQHIPGGTGFYPVTIAAPAFAHTVTLDAANTTGAEIINESSFTVGDAVTLFNDAVLNNQGAASFGQLELFNQSSVLNSGSLTLLQGGDFEGQSTVVNAGPAAIIELAGGTLNVFVDINNSGLVKVDGGAVLNLEGAGATGDFQIGGVLNLEGTSFLQNGSLGNAGQVNVGGAVTFNDEAVINGGLGIINVTDALLLENRTSIVGGTLAVGEAGKLEVSTGGATLLGINIENSHLLQVDQGMVLGFADSTIENGNLVNGGTINSTGASAINGTNITNNGLIEALNSTLTIDHGTLANSDMLEANGGELDIRGETVDNAGTVGAVGDGTLKLLSSTIDNSGPGTMTIGAGSTLDLDNSNISRGTMTVSGTLDSEAGSNTISAAVTEHGGVTKVISGSLDLEGAFAGNIDLAGVSTLTLGATGLSAYAQTTVTYDASSTGTLKLVHSQDFDGTIAGLVGGAIDLLDINSVRNGSTVLPTVTFSGDSAGGTLTVASSVDPTEVAHLQLTGDYTDVQWGVTSDGNGGAIIFEAPTPIPFVVALPPGVNTNSLGLKTETFDLIPAGSASDNGAGFGNFFSATLNATFSATGHAGVVQGSSNVSPEPVVGPLPGEADTTHYLSIGASVGSDVSETISFNTEQNAFGLYWGANALDPENRVEFFQGTTLVASYTGSQIADLFQDVNGISLGGNGYIEFAGLASFNKVVLQSGNTGAFVLDNVSAGFIPPSNSDATETIASGRTLDISGPTTATVIFANNSGNTGELVIDKAADFTGLITRFSGNGTTSNSDLIDLKDINFGNLNKESYVENHAGTGGTLTLSAGTQTASINFSGSYTLQNFKFASDGHGGTLVIDPPVPTSQLEIGTEWHDSRGTGQIWHGIAGLVAEAHNVDAGEISPLALLHAQLAAQHNGFHFL